MTVLFTVSLHSTSSGLHTADIIIKCLPRKGFIGLLGLIANGGVCLSGYFPSIGSNRNLDRVEKGCIRQNLGTPAMKIW